MVVRYQYVKHRPMSIDELDECMSRIRQGDVLSMKYLVANNISLILKILRPTKGLDAEDTMHSILPRIMRALELYDTEKGVLSTYLRRCVNSALSEHYKSLSRMKRDKICYIGDKQWMYNALKVESPRDIMNRKEYKDIRKRAIDKALSNLSIPDQYLIRAHFLKAVRLADIAEYEGVSYQAVRQRKNRILKRMRRDIEHYADDLRG